MTNIQFPSRRSPVMGRNGTVSTSQPLATAAGLEILAAGGNAADAAVATLPSPVLFIIGEVVDLAATIGTAFDAAAEKIDVAAQ